MILKIFFNVGDTLTMSDAYTKLINLNPNDPYAKKKAAGSLGGAINGGTLKRIGYSYTRVR